MLVFLIDELAGVIVSLPLMLLFLGLVDRKRFSKKWAWAALFAVYMNSMMVMVGAPNYEYIRWDPTINWIPFCDFSASNILGMFLNIIMFVPFGVFVPIYFKRFSRFLTTVVAGFFMSFIIEILQLFTFRTTDVDDLIMNTLGAMVGYGIATLILRKRNKNEEADNDIVKLIVMILISIFVVVFIHSQISDLIWSLL